MSNSARCWARKDAKKDARRRAGWRLLTSSLSDNQDLNSRAKLRASRAFDARSERVAHVPARAGNRGGLCGCRSPRGRAKSERGRGLRLAGDDLGAASETRRTAEIMEVVRLCLRLFSSLNQDGSSPGHEHNKPAFRPRLYIRQAVRQPHRRAPRGGARGFGVGAPALFRARTRPWCSRSAPGPTPAGRGAGGLGCAGGRTRTARVLKRRVANYVSSLHTPTSDLFQTSRQRDHILDP